MSILATLAQVFDVGLLGMNGDTLYHVIGMAAYVLLFVGGRYMIAQGSVDRTRISTDASD